MHGDTEAADDSPFLEGRERPPELRQVGADPKEAVQEERVPVPIAEQLGDGMAVPVQERARCVMASAIIDMHLLRLI